MPSPDLWAGRITYMVRFVKMERNILVFPAQAGIQMAPGLSSRCDGVGLSLDSRLRGKDDGSVRLQIGCRYNAADIFGR